MFTNERELVDTLVMYLKEKYKNKTASQLIKSVMLFLMWRLTDMKGNLLSVIESKRKS